MAQQNAKHHVRYYPAHHFVFYPIVLVLMIAALVLANKNPGLKTVWHFIAIVVALVGWLSFMMRQHYALTVQNRVVRLEMRYRYLRLTQKPFEPFELKLSFEQIAALRFASDSELVALVEKAVRENLPASAIKNEVIEWVPDHMRV